VAQPPLAAVDAVLVVVVAVVAEATQLLLNLLHGCPMAR
jgi:hypothetical protein